MIERDYLLRQLAQMMQALVALIRKLTGMKEITEEEVRASTDSILKEQLDITLSDILQFETESIADKIYSLKRIDAQNAELLADILVINAKAEKEPGTKDKLLIRALKLYEWTDRAGNTFSLDRSNKMEDVRRSLEQSYYKK